MGVNSTSARTESFPGRDDQFEIKRLRQNKEPVPKGLVRPEKFSNIMQAQARQIKYGYEMMDALDIPKHLESYGLEWLPMVQDYYDKKYPGMYRIVAIDDASITKPLWKGPLGRSYEVVIYLENQHWDALKSISRFFKLRNYCVGLFLNLFFR